MEEHPALPALTDYSAEPHKKMIVDHWPVASFNIAPPVVLATPAEVTAYCQAVRNPVERRFYEAQTRLSMIKPALNALAEYHQRIPPEIRFNPTAGILLPNAILQDLLDARRVAYADALWRPM